MPLLGKYPGKYPGKPLYRLGGYDSNSCQIFLCLGTHAWKAYSSRFVCHSVILYVRGRYKPGAEKYSMGTARQYLELNSLRFLN